MFGGHVQCFSRDLQCERAVKRNNCTVVSEAGFVEFVWRHTLSYRRVVCILRRFEDDLPEYTCVKMEILLDPSRWLEHT